MMKYYKETFLAIVISFFIIFIKESKSQEIISHWKDFASRTIYDEVSLIGKSKDKLYVRLSKENKELKLLCLNSNFNKIKEYNLPGYLLNSELKIGLHQNKEVLFFELSNSKENSLGLFVAEISRDSILINNSSLISEIKTKFSTKKNQYWFSDHPENDTKLISFLSIEDKYMTLRVLQIGTHLNTNVIIEENIYFSSKEGKSSTIDIVDFYSDINSNIFILYKQKFKNHKYHIYGIYTINTLSKKHISDHIIWSQDTENLRLSPIKNNHGYFLSGFIFDNTKNEWRGAVSYKIIPDYDNYKFKITRNENDFNRNIKNRLKLNLSRSGENLNQIYEPDIHTFGYEDGSTIILFRTAHSLTEKWIQYNQGIPIYQQATSYKLSDVIISKIDSSGKNTWTQVLPIEYESSFGFPAQALISGNLGDLIILTGPILNDQKKLNFKIFSINGRGFVKKIYSGKENYLIQSNIKKFYNVDYKTSLIPNIIKGNQGFLILHNSSK